jgi:hypothetical protein
MKKKNESSDTDSYYYPSPVERTKNYFYLEQNPHEYEDPRLMYSDLKHVLSYIDKIKDSSDKEELEKLLI